MVFEGRTRNSPPECHSPTASGTLTVQAELCVLAGIALRVPGRHGVHAVVVRGGVVDAQDVRLVLAVLEYLEMVIGHNGLVVLEPGTECDVVTSIGPLSAVRLRSVQRVLTT